MNDYEPAPTSKIGALIAAMRATAAARPIWTQDEAAKVMGVARSAIPPYLVSALSHRLLFRRTVQAGLELSLQAFEPPPSGSNYVPYVPTKADVPRPGSDTPVVSGKPPKLCTGCSKAECWDNGCQDAVADAAAVASVTPAPAPTPAPTSAPAPSTATTPEIDPRFAAAHYGHDLRPGDGLVLVQVQNDETPNAAGAGELEQVDEEEDEAVEPDAFYSCRSGEIILVGLEPDEEGRITIPAELVTLIKRQITWSPGR